VGFVLPWQIKKHSATEAELLLQLPEDERWPFGGVAQQRLKVTDHALRLELSLTAGRLAMPQPVLGWHPWFVKPEQLEFAPTHCYPRDAEGIATLPLVDPPWGSPWDDCFINTRPVSLHRSGQSLRLTSDCIHWVVYDERAQATCVEPQLGPPDAFNLLTATALAPGETAHAWFQLEWPR
jgi:aldose 1-epimerase